MGIFLRGSNSVAIFHNLQQNQSKESNIQISQCGTKNSKTNLTGSTTSTRTVDSCEKNISRPTDDTIVQGHNIKEIIIPLKKNDFRDLTIKIFEKKNYK